MAEKPGKQFPARFFNAEGLPLKVLSTSLGIALIAHAVAGVIPSGKVYAEAGAASPEAAADNGPRLVEWSTDAVKSYYDANLDWNLPLLDDGTDDDNEEQSGGGGSSATTGGGGGPSGGGGAVMHSSFGWDDLLLYHLIFNRGTAYSSTTWHNTQTTYDARTGKVYKPSVYDSGTFQNKPVAGSTVRPKTSNTTGSITRRSVSSSPGGIGGKSSGLSSSGSSSSSGHSSISHSGGFGG
ncbi:hypothetical protein [Paenibacillus protaetiae]|uniref:Uncharacterized protein n=1 Tax=Paenibacillus protaetiae TaxID=2509456 RepID=A0A4V0YF49_9BACL|nr:hypothetical protein [Paenibacillus protaetiae]QAY66471.1 hypothetical protein ET464_08665 [Paenibacillus protaetiae]